MSANTQRVRRIGGVIMIALTAGHTAVRADARAEYENLLKNKVSALVTVKFVMKVQGQFGDSETESEITAVLIDPKGLVLCSSMQLGGARWLQMSGTTATPTDMKVLIGDDTEGLDAKLVSRDSELDLAWVKIDDPGDDPLPFLDLAKAGKPTPGQRLLCMRRLGKFFDRVAVVAEGPLAGKTDKPRELLIPGAGLEVESGLPVFMPDGRVVGVVVFQMPDPEDLESARPARGDWGQMILPAAAVAKATERAMAAVADEDEDEDDSEDDKPTTKPADDKAGQAESGG